MIKEKILLFLKNEYIVNNITELTITSFTADWRFKNYSARQKEIINSTIEFFSFFQNNEICEKLDKIYLILLENIHRIELQFKNSDFFFISIIILKAFLAHSPIYSTNFGGYKNSDKLLDYCVEMCICYYVFYDINYKEKKQIRGVFHLCFHLLIKANIVEEKKIKVNKFSSKFWNLKIENKINSTDIDFKISYIPFSLKKHNENTYLIGQFFWNVYDIYSKNFYSDTRFNITKEEYIDLLIKRYLHINVSYFEYIKLRLGDDLTDINEVRDELLNELKTDWKVDKKGKIENIQKKYSKKIESICLYNFLKTKFNEKDKIYFPFYFDFRGRKYYNSMVGPTQNKILRFVYHYGWYDSSDFSNIVKIKRILFFKKKIQLFCETNGFEYNDVFLESYFWLLIGIGKFGIDKSQITIADEDILENGIRLLLSVKQNSLELADDVEIMHYSKLLESLKLENLNNIRKGVISKDGTASVYQISTLLLKPKSQEILKWVNLDNENCWVDTYSFIIAKFKETLKNNHALDFLNRKTAKKTLMTIPYSIGKKSAYLSFVELLMKFQPEINATTPQIDKTFKKFYNFVKYDFEKKFLYSISSDEYTNSIMQNFLTSRNIRIETDTGLTDLAYKKMQKKTIDLIFNMRIGNETIKERVTKMIMVPSKSIDYSQTNISLGANLRHFYEADILRITEIHLAYSINSIHDAELIDFNSCSKLILIKNRIFGELLPEFNVWSLFILI